jgi:hypothetical protein
VHEEVAFETLAKLMGGRALIRKRRKGKLCGGGLSVWVAFGTWQWMSGPSWPCGTMRDWKCWYGACKMILARSQSPTKVVLEMLIEVVEEKHGCESDRMKKGKTVKIQEKMLVSF